MDKLKFVSTTVYLEIVGSCPLFPGNYVISFEWTYSEIDTLRIFFQTQRDWSFELLKWLFISIGHFCSMRSFTEANSMFLAKRFVNVVGFCSRINQDSSREIMQKYNKKQESFVVSLERV